MARERASQEGLPPPKPGETQCRWNDWGACAAPFPELSRRAADVMGLFLLNETQVRAAFGAVLGLDRTAVRLVGEDVGMEFDADTWTLFDAIEREWLKAVNPKDEVDEADRWAGGEP